MRILCVNDDGVHAMGLTVLERIARRFSDDVWIIAPETEQSGASRALTLSAPVRVRPDGPKRFAISGTPTDCVLLGVQDLMADGPPDLVLSGVNRGQNIADDVTLSGTIAAAIQGMQLGVASIALSQARGLREGAPIAWETAERFGPDIIARLLAAGWPQNIVMNVNFPDCPPEDVAGVEATRQGHRDHLVLYADQRTDLRGQHYYWLGFRGQLSDPPPGTDLHAIYHQKISVTPLHIDLTHQATLQRLAADLAAPA